jgi:hypothetical protein
MFAPETPSDSDPRDHAAPEHDLGTASASQSPDVGDPPSRRRPAALRPRPARPPLPRLASGRGAGSPSPVSWRRASWGSGSTPSDVNSDLVDANAKAASQPAKITSQQKELDDAQSTGAGVVAAAKTAYADLSSKLGATQQDASQSSEQAAAKLDEAEQAAADAKGTAEEVEKKADAAQVKAEAAACAQSFLMAFSGVFSGATLKEGVEATVAELTELQPKCVPALGQGGSGP